VGASGHDAVKTADLSNVPFHFETVDDGHAATISASHPLPAISFSFALAFPAKTPPSGQTEGVPIPVLSIAISDLTPALLPDGPASLFTAPH
jgi:hypothetical protein